LDEAAEDNPLRQGRDGRPAAKRPVPEAPEARAGKAELERDTAEHQRQQHDQDREVDGWYDDREGKRERRHEPDAAEHQPGFVAVPDRRDRAHRRGAVGRVADEAVEDADAEVKTVEDDVIEHRERQEHGPDRDEVEHHRYRSGRAKGEVGCPPSAGAALSSTTPRRTNPAMTAIPVGNITRYTIM